MGLLAAALLGALVVGRLAGGRPVRLARLRVRGVPVLALALTAQVLGALAGGAAYAVGLAVSALLSAVVLVANRRLPGVPLVGLGLLLNALVVAANGAMPVSAPAAAHAGVPFAAAVRDVRHEPVGPHTRLGALADVVPVPLPVRPEVASPGDLLAAAGLGLLVLGTTLTPPPRRRPTRRRGRPRPAPAGVRA